MNNCYTSADCYTRGWGKIPLFIILGLFLISFASAIYPGENKTYTNEIGKDNLVWVIVDNSSEMSVFPIVSFNLTNITIQIPSNMPPNSFGVSFIENVTNTIPEVQTIQVSTGSSGGHSSRTKTIYKNNTEYIDVPVIEYVNNETIKLVENKTIETKWNTIEKPTKWTWIFAGGFLILVIIICVICVVWSNSIERNIDERRLEE